MNSQQWKVKTAAIIKSFIVKNSLYTPQMCAYTGCDKS